MTTTPNFKRTKLACYTAYFTMSSVFCIPPLLFVTLRETYGISYTLLGTLVLVNFVTQLGVDLVFTLLQHTDGAGQSILQESLVGVCIFSTKCKFPQETR